MNKQLAVGSMLTDISKLAKIADFWNTHFLDLDQTEDDLLTAIDVAVKSLMLYETKMKERLI